MRYGFPLGVPYSGTHVPTGAPGEPGVSSLHRVNQPLNEQQRQYTREEFLRILPFRSRIWQGGV